MNEPHDELDELLAPLRGVEPTRLMREANRHAAFDARVVVPWWRRSVAVPVPVVAGLAAVLLLAVGARFLSVTDTENRRGNDLPSVVSPTADPTGATMIARSTSQKSRSVLDSASYVAGVGFVERVNRYEPMESR